MANVATAEAAPRTVLRRLPWGSLAVLLAFIFMGVFAGILAPHAPEAMSLPDRLKPPGWESSTGKVYILGTDKLGRDVLSRMLYGARVSLTIAAAALLVGGTFGLAIGIISAYMGGAVDALLMRLTDCFLALPTLLVALVFVMTMGGGLQTVVIAISIFIWAQFARVIRSEVLSLKERGYVAQARVAGCSNTRIMMVHILPNVVNTFVVLCSLQVSACVLTEATLSFLGAGVPQPTPTWGNMVADGRDFITSAWWIGAFPGIALTIVVLSFNTFGDWLRDRLDPKLAQL